MSDTEGVLRLEILAHVPTEATHAARFALPGDAPGRAAEGVAARLAADAGTRRRPARLLVAPERRAVDTARALGLGVPVAGADAFRDIDLGEWAGRELASIPGADIVAWASDPAFTPPDGESVEEYCARVGAGLDALPGEGPTLLVAHPSTARAAVIHALSAPASAFFRIDAGPGHAVALHRRGGRWTLRLPSTP